MYRYTLLCLLLNVYPVLSWAQTFSVEPLDALSDTELSIQVSELSPGQSVVIKSEMSDSRGRIWQAQARFMSDQNGVIDLRNQAPESGDYADVDPMGLIHAMQIPNSTVPSGRFTLSQNEPMRVRFSLEIDSREHAVLNVTRRIASEDLEKSEVRTGRLLGRFYKPPGHGPYPGVLLLGGSSGGLSGAVKAGLLASHGFAVLTVAYFAEEGLPPDLQDIPLEYFKESMDWLSAQSSVAPGGVSVYGTSKGAEAALLVGAHYPEIRSVVAVVPSNVVWRCICNVEGASSWSLNGEPLPYATPQNDPTYEQEPGNPFRAATRYLQGLKDQAAVEAARIPVEQINGPILLVSGTDDQLWPSYAMSEMIVQQLAENDFSYEFTHLAMEGAGHSIRSLYLPLAGTTSIANGRLSLGGTYEGIRGGQSSWKKIIAFLKKDAR
ncbi:MAG: acyl-CoA thioesterase/BAAT N-terminal domain-containing protein [Rhodothermaceae bacterium]|nr:acyl-CoA thioesterase/BAAT N-terminal domain-containing protein [Rhodothermaceae bacterium]